MKKEESIGELLEKQRSNRNKGLILIVTTILLLFFVIHIIQIIPSDFSQLKQLEYSLANIALISLMVSMGGIVIAGISGIVYLTDDPTKKEQDAEV